VFCFWTELTEIRKVGLHRRMHPLPVPELLQNRMTYPFKKNNIYGLLEGIYSYDNKRSSPTTCIDRWAS